MYTSTEGSDLDTLKDWVDEVRNRRLFSSEEEWRGESERKQSETAVEGDDSDYSVD